jgi:hypothetical protein
MNTGFTVNPKTGAGYRPPKQNNAESKVVFNNLKIRDHSFLKTSTLI